MIVMFRLFPIHLPRPPQVLLPRLRSIRNCAAVLLHISGLACASLLTIHLLASRPVLASEARYVLGTQDRVRISVFEWRPSRDEVFEWSALNNEYTIGSTGSLSLPLIGEVPARGSSTTDLASSISERLKQRLGLVTAPDVSVEIVQHRPFYIVGQVSAPGEYPFRPGLTVLRAVSIAGGLQRASYLSLTRSITAMGELQLHALETNSLLARRARLEAELNGLDEINFPEPLTQRRHMTSIAILMEQEGLILEARRDAISTHIQAYEQLRGHLQKEVASLKAQIQALDKQAALFKREHEGVASLVTRGLAVTSRQLELERAMASMEGDRLRLETSLMKVRQDISRTEISVLELRNNRKTELTLELRLTQTRLDEVRQKYMTAERLLQEVAMTSTQLGRGGQRPQPTYSIIRQLDGEVQNVPATEITLIEPGDTIKVEFPMEEESTADLLLEPNTAASPASETTRHVSSAIRLRNQTMMQPE